MFKEHAQVTLKRALPSLGLQPGAVGIVVHVHTDFEGYEVEFLNWAGQTIGVETVEDRDLERFKMGDALAELGRKIGLTDADAELINRAKDKTPAQPLRLD